MSGFFDRMLGRNKDDTSANTAKERLKFVLVHDRINLPPEQLKMMKSEILAVISKYVSVASEDVEIALEQHDRNDNRLIAEVPFSRRIELLDDVDEAEMASASLQEGEIPLDAPIDQQLDHSADDDFYESTP